MRIPRTAVTIVDISTTPPTHLVSKVVTSLVPKQGDNFRQNEILYEVLETKREFVEVPKKGLGYSFVVEVKPVVTKQMYLLTLTSEQVLDRTIGAIETLVAVKPSVLNSTTLIAALTKQQLERVASWIDIETFEVVKA